MIAFNLEEMMISKGCIVGVLQIPAAILSGEDLVVYPAGSKVEIVSDDNWEHEISTKDIEDAVALLR